MSLVHPAIYTHIQDTESDQWIIEHGLGGNGGLGIPMVDTFIYRGAALQKIICKVTVLSANSVQIDFKVPRRGKAIIVV